MINSIEEANMTVEELQNYYDSYIRDSIKKYHNNNLCKMLEAKSDNQLINTLNRGNLLTLKKWAEKIHELEKIVDNVY